MSKIPEAEEMLKQESNFFIDDYEEISGLMIKFARIHVEAALKEASENAETKWVKFTKDDYEIDKDSILNAYPLENIK